ncbi:multicopper oxidase family protein [Longispora urticae]
MAPHPRARPLFGCLATVIVLAPLAWFWYASLVPDSYSIMDMGHADRSDGHHHGTRSVQTLTVDPGLPADVKVTLTARAERFALASGRWVRGYTLNGTSPGPVIRAVQGQLVEVALVNESVEDGTTLHWHGVDVPNASDGVAGVTQDAVAPGGSHTYRFFADRAGTYWYHAHQFSHEQVKRGLFGAVVIAPRPPAGPVTGPLPADHLALVHRYDGVRTVDGRTGDVPVPADPGGTVRVRVVNTDNGPMNVWTVGGPYRVVAVDGTEVHEPSPVTGEAVLVTAGGRADLELVVPAGGVRVELGGDTALLLTPPGSTPPPGTAAPRRLLDLLSYGTPAPTDLDPNRVTREFTYDIGRRPGFLDGRPGLWWTINGRMFPDMPMFHVTEGDVVRFRISNHSGEVHPMHLHGHHALVLSRDGDPATGSPWWIDSLNVADGESYDIVFLADNPGVWADHCHNLPHATQGLVGHLLYDGVSTPYRIGGGGTANHPE